MPLFIIFVVLPIAEMWLLIETGSQIGGLNTIGLVVLTAMIGAACLRYQGTSMLFEAQRKMQTGELPAQEMFGGLMLAIAGVCLITPGFITDSFGFLLLVPGLRQLLAKTLFAKLFTARARPQQDAFFHYEQHYQTRRDDDIIEGEVVDSDDSDKRLR